MRLPLFTLKSPFGVWGLLAMQKTPRPSSLGKEWFAKFKITLFRIIVRKRIF
jgi:hypothetical protein